MKLRALDLRRGVPAAVLLLFVMTVGGYAQTVDNRVVKPPELKAVQSEKFSDLCQHSLPEDFTPMTFSRRGAYYLVRALGPSAFVYSAGQAGFTQLLDIPKEWGQGSRGFGLRMGNAFAEQAIDNTLEFGSSWMLHEDNRYFASGRSGFWKRFGYAVSSAVLTRHDNGSRGFAWSGVGSAAGSAFISQIWQPRSTSGLGDTMLFLGLQIGGSAGMNVLREFSPRYLGRLLR